MRGIEWKWIRESVTEVVVRKNGMGMDAYEWIENIDAIKNEKAEMCGDEGDGGEIGWKGILNKEQEGMINEMGENEF